MSIKNVDLIYGHSAHEILRDQEFLGLWRNLYGKCSYATAFQAPSFVCTWYEIYQFEWQPVLIKSHGATGELVGLWLLAHNAMTNELANAGAHQAEYQTWLALPSEDISFLSAAWNQLNQQFAFATLRFKYLPSATLGDTLRLAIGATSVVVRKHRRPLLNLDPDDVKASFAKKRYKSRFNRLKKLGKLEFKRVTDSAELERIFDELIAYYDFRQGAINHSTPFQEDPRKRKFHSNLFDFAPDETYLSVTYLDEHPIAAFWGASSRSTVHLEMLFHSPFLAEISPGRLHIMQLSEHLLKEGKNVIDLTPGGDVWKENIANEHDDVAEATLYRSDWARIQAVAFDRGLLWGKWCLARVGLTAADVKSTLGMLRRTRPDAVMRKIKNWYGIERELRIYRLDRVIAESYFYDERVRCNSLADLISFEPGESWQTRDAFLSSALARLEHGECAYTVRIDNRLAHCGWMVEKQAESHMAEVKQSMSFPPGSAVLYDFYTHPDFRGRGLYRATIGHMLHDAFANDGTQYAYISVVADNLPSRHVIETMGFEYQCSFFLACCFGKERKWSNCNQEMANA